VSASATATRSVSATPTPTFIPSGTFPPTPAPTASPIPGDGSDGSGGPLSGAQRAVPKPFLKFHDPTDISLDPLDIGVNLLMAIIMLGVILFTSNVINGIIGENLEEIPSFFGKLFGPVKKLMPAGVAEGATATPLQIGAALFSVLAVLLLNGLIYSFLDPNFGWNNESLVMFLSLVIGVAIVTYVYGMSQVLLTSRRFGVPAGIKLFPIALGIAVFSVVISRVTEFQPGIVYGFVASYALLANALLEDKQNGQVVFYPSLVLMAFCVLCWFLVLPARELTGDSEGWYGALPEAILVTIFIGGLEGLFFNLMPIEFLEGKYVWDWSKIRWLMLMILAAFLFWHVLLNSEGAYDEMIQPTSALTAGIVIAICVTLTGSAWLYFKLKNGGEELAEVRAD
jgi:hypothetical protein